MSFIQQRVGRWFYLARYFVFPIERAGQIKPYRHEHSPKGASQPALPRTWSTDEGSLNQRFQVLHQGLKVAWKQYRNLSLHYYNWQLAWSLREVRANSLQDARQVIGEFLEFARCAAGEFDWSVTFLKGMKVRQHAWKHTWLQHIEGVLEELKPGMSWLPELLLDSAFMGPHPEQIFEKAAGRDPAAVARLSHLFHHSKKGMLQAAGELFNEETARALVSQIPSVEQLAADLAYEVSRDPDSPEAEVARSNLKTLASKAAAKGIAMRTRRPPVQFDRGTIQLVFEISYALNKQVIEVNKFLEPFLRLREQRSRELESLFADLSKLLGGRLIDLADRQPTNGACLIAGAAMKMSPSKVEKTIYG
jgi:hypothetical protein